MPRFPFQTTVSSLKHETFHFSSETTGRKPLLNFYKPPEIKFWIPLEKSVARLLQYCYIFISMATPEAVDVYKTHRRHFQSDKPKTTTDNNLRKGKYTCVNCSTQNEAIN